MLCVQANIGVKKHKLEMDTILVYIVHPSGSDLLEKGSTKVRTCGMHDPF